MKKDFYLFSDGILKRKDNNVLFEMKDGKKVFLPIESVEKIHIFGNIDLNSKIINFLNSKEIMVNFYNYYGFFTGSLLPKRQKISGYLVVKQVENFLNYDKRFYLAASFVESAAFHSARNLRKHKNTETDIDKINQYREKIFEVKSIEELMSIEGRIKNIYYKSFNKFLPNEFIFTKRTRRPPADKLNSLISFGNSLIYTTILGEIFKTPLDPSISYLHEPGIKRFSLSLDLSEIFKPLIVDSIIFNLINNKMLKNEDFDIDSDFCFLSEIGKKKFLKVYDEKLNSTIKHRKLKRKVSYKTLILLECYKLIKHLLNDETYKPFKAWW
jgi:CRISPR-associated protein Cas1